MLFRDNPDTSFIVKTERVLKGSEAEVSVSLERISKLNFWKAHFQNTGFAYKKEKFDWVYWQKIPTMTLRDFEGLGLELRLQDVKSEFKENIKKFILAIPFRKVKGQYLLFIDTVVTPKGPEKRRSGSNSEDGQEVRESLAESGMKVFSYSPFLRWKVSLIDSYVLNLKQVLFSLRAKSKQEFLVISSGIKGQKLQASIRGIKITAAYTDPRSLVILSRVFDKEILLGIKKIILTRWVKRGSALENLEDFMNADFFVEHPFVGFGMAFKHCSFLQKTNTPNAVHPRKHAIIELLNRDTTGHGELMVTTFKPEGLEWIKYRTGITAKAVFKRCKCGANWALVIRHMTKFQFNRSQKTSQA